MHDDTILTPEQKRKELEARRADDEAWSARMKRADDYPQLQAENDRLKAARRQGGTGMIDTTLELSRTPNKALARNLEQREQCAAEGWEFAYLAIVGTSGVWRVLPDGLYHYIALPHYIGERVIDTNGKELNASDSAMNIYRKTVQS